MSEMLLDKLYLSLNPLWLSRQIDAETDKLLGHGMETGRAAILEHCR